MSDTVSSTTPLVHKGGDNKYGKKGACCPDGSVPSVRPDNGGIVGRTVQVSGMNIYLTTGGAESVKKGQAVCCSSGQRCTQNTL